MNSIMPVLALLLVTMMYTIMAHPANSEWEYTADDCPPGIWVCRKKRAVVPKPEDANECPPGIWTCQKKRNVVPKPEITSVSSDGCPPGIWTCKRKRILEAAKQRALNAVREVDTNRQQILKRLMKEKAREIANTLNAANVQESQMKRSKGECPPGIWVC